MLVVRQVGDLLFLFCNPRGHDDEMHGLSPASEKEAIMDTAGNKDLARRLYTLINEGRVDQVANLISPDYIEHDPLPGQGSGQEGVLDRFSMITTALAPQFTVEDLITERDRIVVRWTNRGTHVGEFAGIPATSRTFTIAGIDIYRVADEQLCEHWHVIDQLGMLAQLGLLPQPAAA
jgi:steroid delta-isomerase-like uncharacterized protein